MSVWRLAKLRMTPIFNIFCLRGGHLPDFRCQLAPRPGPGGADLWVLFWPVILDPRPASVTSQMAAGRGANWHWSFFGPNVKYLGPTSSYRKSCLVWKIGFLMLYLRLTQHISIGHRFGVDFVKTIFLTFIKCQICPSNRRPGRLKFSWKHPPIVLIHPPEHQYSGSLSILFQRKYVFFWPLARGRDQPFAAWPPASVLRTLAVAQKTFDFGRPEILNEDDSVKTDCIFGIYIKFGV